MSPREKALLFVHAVGQRDYARIRHELGIWLTPTGAAITAKRANATTVVITSGPWRGKVVFS